MLNNASVNTLPSDVKASKGIAPSSIVNSWQPYTTTYPTGSLVRYVRITINSSTYTSDNRLKDFEVIIND